MGASTSSRDFTQYQTSNLVRHKLDTFLSWWFFSKIDLFIVLTTFLLLKFSPEDAENPSYWNWPGHDVLLCRGLATWQGWDHCQWSGQQDYAIVCGVQWYRKTDWGCRQKSGNVSFVDLWALFKMAFIMVVLFLFLTPAANGWSVSKKSHLFHGICSSFNHLDSYSGKSNFLTTYTRNTNIEEKNRKTNTESQHLKTTLN